jgi:hypothetical protein
MSPAPECLVRHGLSGFLARCRPDGPLPGRGDRVVVRTARGEELAEVLCEAADASLPLADLIRPATDDDQARATALAGRGQAVFAAAVRLADDLGLPLTVLDVEVLFSGDEAVLHAVRFGDCQADGYFERLSAEAGLRVTLLDLTRPAGKSAGCGKEGCGSAGGGCTSCGSGGGCGTGSCSRGAARSPDELRDYFLGLRRQMESAGRVPLPQSES